MLRWASAAALAAAICLWIYGAADRSAAQFARTLALEQQQLEQWLGPDAGVRAWRRASAWLYGSGANPLPGTLGGAPPAGDSFAEAFSALARSQVAQSLIMAAALSMFRMSAMLEWALVCAPLFLALFVDAVCTRQRRAVSAQGYNAGAYGFFAGATMLMVLSLLVVAFVWVPVPPWLWPAWVVSFAILFSRAVSHYLKH